MLTTLWHLPQTLAFASHIEFLTAILEIFCSAFITAHQHSDQQVTDRPTNRDLAHISKRGAANTGARSSAEDESGCHCDGESGERFVPDELLHILSLPARTIL